MLKWLLSLKVYLDVRMAVLLGLGFSSGLPRLLVYSTLTFWLLDVGLDIKMVGLFAATATPYTIKFLWAPLVDRMPLPVLTRWLGRRRSWIFFTQMALLLAIFGMALSNPAEAPVTTAIWALVVSAASATHDIVVDAYRIELLNDDEQGAGAAAVVFGYRAGMLVAGAGALYLVTWVEAWGATYIAMAGFMALCLLVTVFAREPDRVRSRRPPPEVVEGSKPPGVVDILVREFIDGVLGPFMDFFQRRGWYLFLLFIVLYKLGDALAGAMTNPLLVDLGFTKVELANVAKPYGRVGPFAGVFRGGWVVRGAGVVRALWIAGFLQMASNLMFALQAWTGADPWLLIGTIGIENLTGGVGTAAFVAYLSGLCNKEYSATQYALLTALAGLIRTLLSTVSGVAVEWVGWINYFVLTTVAALPGLIVLYFLMKYALTGLEKRGVGEVGEA